MANELSIGMYIDWDEHFDSLNWFKPTPTPQLLPKDLMKYGRKISGAEADKHILNAIQKPSMYSHSNNTSQWMNPMWGTTTSVPTHVSWSSVHWTSSNITSF